MKKRMMVLFIAGVIAVGLLAGCSSDSTESDSSQSQDTTTGQTTEEAETAGDSTAETAADTSEETGKTLVVYYSATGTTEGVAETLAEVTGADLFEIEPTEPYTDDDLNWTDDDSRVSVEHENEDQRDVELVSTTVDDWDSYDTVYIGYPIWWGIAAWPVNGFVEANDFTGKTVIPFCTAASSGIGDSGELLAELAGTGNWIDGDRISRNASADEIQEWVDGLGL